MEKQFQKMNITYDPIRLQKELNIYNIKKQLAAMEQRKLELELKIKIMTLNEEIAQDRKRLAKSKAELAKMN